ncbi:TetR/AcrR family transcriptional regulator [Larkinella arboricola]|uniref:TetR family transcriptional regulator n=1 Tax=Larkinella arboricola TaxID=643671 RepID=A0A327XFW6_LARAB|nr:TetR/AcrR family transcriptional regulator [Larkinella arboricola]RAK03066.1 TetR family transcriptional regulator [Larkinella arboricola]
MKPKHAEQNTEQKIKEAAKKVFLERGFDGAKLRHIAEEAGTTMAMVNYYFRSKEQLFQSIFLETLGSFLGRVVSILNEEVPLEIKVWKVVDNYTDFLTQNPHVPVFVLAELQKDSSEIFEKLNVKSAVESSFFVRQLAIEGEKGAIRPVKPLQLIVTMLGSLIFPFMAKPIISYIGAMDNGAYQAFLEERKVTVFETIMAYLKPT